MIGFYDYTVILTYISLLSAGTGIVVSLSGSGHPYYGCLFLLLSGLCDAFDGKVARTKKDRSKTAMNFGIQIDSLSDIVAFGVLPACIGEALIGVSPMLNSVFNRDSPNFWIMIIKFLLHAVLILYILAALIRLAYYNVTEEERQSKESTERKYYVGLPVTSSALICPLILLLQYILPADITLIYIAVILLIGFLFLYRFQIRKPGFKGLMLMVGFGAVEFIFLIIWKVFTRLM